MERKKCLSTQEDSKKKKKIEHHQNKNQFTEKDMWKWNPQMNKIFTVHISEKPHAAINREKQKAH